MAKGSSVWKMTVFDAARKCRERAVDGTDWQKPYYKTEAGWIVFGPRDVRSGTQKYYFSLERLNEDKVLRVRAGCRYYTIAQAFKHWDPTIRGWTNRRNECRQARAIIMLMVLQAQAYGFLSLYNEKIKFDLKLKPKPKRK